MERYTDRFIDEWILYREIDIFIIRQIGIHKIGLCRKKLLNFFFRPLIFRN